MKNLQENISKIKSMGYLVKLDTNGSNYECLKNLIDKKIIDYVAMDIKNSIEEYNNIICVNNKEIINNVKKSIELLKQNVIDYEFRTTLVNEFHNEKNIDEIGKLLNGSKTIYLQKFVNREGCITQGLNEVEIKKALEFKCILEKYVSNVNLRGY